MLKMISIRIFRHTRITTNSGWAATHIFNELSATKINDDINVKLFIDLIRENAYYTDSKYSISINNNDNIYEFWLSYNNLNEIKKMVEVAHNKSFLNKTKF